MKKIFRWAAPLAVILMLFGCTDFGKVNQGRVIEYDKEKGVVTYIQDTNYNEPGKPKYEKLPPITVKIPTNPAEMGPDPEPGKRMKIDVEKRQIIIFDTAIQDFKTIDYTQIDRQQNVSRSDPRVEGQKFPMVDREKKTIAVYSARQKEMVVFSVPEEYFAYPDNTWKAGDEIRYYYKEPGQSLRMMNITKTDIFKK